MKKSTLAPAILTLSMMLSPSNANAFWLDIVKSLASGIFGTVKEQTKTSVQKSTAVPASNASSGTPPTQDEIIAALDKLTTECQNLSAKGFPCAIAEGRGTTRGNALKVANTRSIQEMAKSMNSFVEGSANDIFAQIQEDGMVTDRNEFDEKMTLTVRSEVAGSQTYLTYTYTEEKGGKTVYVVYELRILNAALFEKALGDAAQGKPLSQQVLDEARRGVADKIKSLLKKK
jgi:hypothetical protein